jgi:peroxiredoxin family protein
MRPCGASKNVIIFFTFTSVETLGQEGKECARSCGASKNVIIFFTFTSVETLGQEGKECARWCDSKLMFM